MPRVAIDWSQGITRQATREDFARPTYKMEPHSFKGRALNYTYCTECGLVRMRHPFAKWCERMGCLNEYHPGYRQWTSRRS